MSLDKQKMGGAGRSHTTQASLPCPQLPLGTAIDEGNSTSARRNPLHFLQLPCTWHYFFSKKHGAFTFFKDTPRLPNNISIIASNDWYRNDILPARWLRESALETFCLNIHITIWLWILYSFRGVQSATETGPCCMYRSCLCRTPSSVKNAPLP